MRINRLGNSHFLNIRVTEDGVVWRGLGEEPPDDPEIPRLILKSQWRLEFHRRGQSAETILSLDAQTGEVGPLGEDEQWDVPAHIHCFLLRPRTAHCTSSWGHTPAMDVYWLVEDDGAILARAGEHGPTATVARVEPPPRTDLEAFQALFLLIEQVDHGDDHGDSAHDVEF